MPDDATEDTIDPLPHGAVDDALNVGLPPAYWREQAYETDQLNGRLAALLHATARVLKGEPPPNGIHDLSDVPAVAQGQVDALKWWRDQALEAQDSLAAMRRRAEAAEHDMTATQLGVRYVDWNTDSLPVLGALVFLSRGEHPYVVTGHAARVEPQP